MSTSQDIASTFAALSGRIAELERKLNNIMRPGEVTEVDAAKGLVKVKVGDLDSAWMPWSERAGAIKTWTPPSVGEQVHLFSPGGEPGQGWVMAGGFSDANPQPHDKSGEHKIVASKVLITGDVVITGSVTMNGESVTHNNRNIGDTHTHKGVMAGLNNTADPN